MYEALTEADREEAVYVLKKRLKPKQMREVIDQDIERLVARTEHSKGLLINRIENEDLPNFLIDLAGTDLLQDRKLREMLVRSLPQDQIAALAAWDGRKPPRSLDDRVERIVSRRWFPGKHWPRHFASVLGFPKIFAGLVGSPTGPAVEEIEPRIPLPELHDYQQELVGQLYAIFKGAYGLKPQAPFISLPQLSHRC